MLLILIERTSISSLSSLRLEGSHAASLASGLTLLGTGDLVCLNPLNHLFVINFDNNNIIVYDTEHPNSFSLGPCYYVGNSQGGKSGESDNNDPVIEGKYSDYEVAGLFEYKFIYSQFEEDRCVFAQ